MLPTDIEQLLIAKMLQKQEDKPSNELAMGAGAAVGGLAGVGLAYPAHKVGQAIGGLKGTNHMLKPGLRMAGGLTLAALGGALGPTVRDQMINNSAEAEILARYQAGTPAPGDEIRLQQLLADQYRSIGIA